MKRLLALAFAMVLSAATQAATTVFTLGPPTNNYLPVLTQDGEPTSGIWYANYVFDCALRPSCSGLPQSGIEIVLPNDPTNPGYRLYLYSCAGTVTLDTRPYAGGSAEQQPDGVLQSSEICGTWSGTITYNYISVLQKHCSSGHPACAAKYYPVLVSGSGMLRSP
jgi:hypothetical protein